MPRTRSIVEGIVVLQSPDLKAICTRSSQTAAPNRNAFASDGPPGRPPANPPLITEKTIALFRCTQLVLYESGDRGRIG